MTPIVLLDNLAEFRGKNRRQILFYRFAQNRGADKRNGRRRSTKCGFPKGRQHTPYSVHTFTDFDRERRNE